MANPRPEIVVSFGQYSTQNSPAQPEMEALALLRRMQDSPSAMPRSRMRFRRSICIRLSQHRPHLRQARLIPSDPRLLSPGGLRSRGVGIGTYANNWFDGHYVWLI